METNVNSSGNVFLPTGNRIGDITSTVGNEDLGDAVRRIRSEKRLSLDDVRRRSGNSLAASYISRIENKQVLADVISLGKLRSLAKGLDEPIDALFRIALQLPTHDGELVSKIRENAAKLSLHRQQDLLSIAQMYFGEQQRNLQRFNADPKVVTRLSVDEDVRVVPVKTDGSIGEPKQSVSRAKKVS